MEKEHFSTNEPDELVAHASKKVMQWGKLGDWKNGYGKYTVAAVLLYAVYSMADAGFPALTTETMPAALFTYAQYVVLFLIAFYIYRDSLDSKDALVVNSKGILHHEKVFYWPDVLSFQLSLEKEKNKRYHAFYLHLKTKDLAEHKIDISPYNKTFDQIHRALCNNKGKHDVQDLGFTQII